MCLFRSALPIQLASKLTPEIEAVDAAVIRRIEAECGLSALPPPNLQTAEVTAVRAKRYEQLYIDTSHNVDDFNHFVSTLTSGGGILDPKV